MVKRVRNEKKEEKALSLLVSFDEAAKKIEERIQTGNKIIGLDCSTIEMFKEIENKYNIWDDYNEELLRTLFSSEKIANEYKYVITSTTIKDVWGGFNLRVELSELKEKIEAHINKLNSIKERLSLFPVIAGIPTQNDSYKLIGSSNKVFIVHGHDSSIKNEVARLLEKLGLEPIILHEQPNGGKTIVEKLEANSSDTRFAIILLTPDDEGKAKSEHEYKHRARQNVIAELGFFIGKLGRSNICPLYVQGVDIPSDFLGLIYVPIDEAGAWRFQLAKELKTAEYQIDVNNIL